MAENQSSTGAAAVAEPVADNSPSVASWLGEQFGDFSDSATAEPEQDAGTPPPAASDIADGSEGADASAPPGSLPREADDSSRPDPSTPEIVPDDDPLDGSRALDYNVDGAAKTFDGITLLKNGAAIIDADQVAQVRQILSKHDFLLAKDQSQHREHQDLLRLTQWPSRNPDGTQRTLSGREGLEAQRVVLAQSLSRDTSTWKFLEDPSKLVSLVTVQPTGRQYEDGTPEYQMVVNKTAFDAFKREVALDARDTIGKARDHFSTLATPAPAAPVEDTPESLASPTIAMYETQFGVTGLTAEDKTFLAAHFPQYLRSSTPEERQQGLGPKVVDPRFLELMKDRAARNANTARVVTTATDAAKANAAKLAAASQGKGLKQSSKITNTKEPERTREDDFDEAWRNRQRAASGAMRAHAFGNR